MNYFRKHRLRTREITMRRAWPPEIVTVKSRFLGVTYKTVSKPKQTGTDPE